MEFRRYLIGGLIVTVPLVILDQVAPEYSWPYIALITIALLIFYSQELGEFTNEINLRI
jgi:hypothetical protein